MRGHNRCVAILCIMVLCITSIGGCSLFKKEEDYGLKGRPADENNSVFVLNGDYQKEGYQVVSPVFLQSDDTLVIAYSSKTKTIISQYNYIDATASEVELEAGIELVKCGTNGNILAFNDIAEQREYYVYNSKLTMIATSKDLDGASENIMMSGNGQYLYYAAKDGMSVLRYNIADKKTETLYAIEKDKYAEAQVHISEVSEDATTAVVAVDVLAPASESHVYLCDVTDGSVTEVKCDDEDFGISGDSYVIYQKNNDDGEYTNIVKSYDAAGLKSGTATDVIFEKNDESKASTINKTQGYALSMAVNGKNSKETQGIVLKNYDLSQGKVTKSVIASAENMFNTLSKGDDTYKDMNYSDWIDSVDTQVGMIRYNSDKSHVIASFTDRGGFKVLVWRLNDNSNAGN